VSVESASSPASVTIRRRVEWSDTDASGAHHNTAVFRFIEAAETTLLERIGLVEDVYGRHPRVRLEAEFTKPLWFRDDVEIDIRVAEVGRTSVAYEAEIARDGTTCVRGRMVAVLLDRPGGRPVPWSVEQRRALLESGPQQPG
jgi:YbgC/YbaW family acyl-CoA thioester hydrolase